MSDRRTTTLEVYDHNGVKVAFSVALRDAMEGGQDELQWMFPPSTEPMVLTFRVRQDIKPESERQPVEPSKYDDWDE